MSKSDMRSFHNQRGEGKVFSVDLVDAVSGGEGSDALTRGQTGEIRGTFFNSTADKFYDHILPNKVYLISRGNIKLQTRKFGNQKGDYEIMFSDSSTFALVGDDEAPRVKYSFTPISKLEETKPSSVVDVIGVIEVVQPESSIVVKNGPNQGKSMPKREVTLVDEMGRSIGLTLWDNYVRTISEDLTAQHPVVAIRNCRVGDFQGRSLSTSRDSVIELNPDLHEANVLRGWYDTQRENVTLQPMSSTGGAAGDAKRPSEVLTFSAIKERNLGVDKPDYFTVHGTIMLLKNEKFAYPACPEADVNSKVVKVAEGWKCERTNRVYPNCDYRYIMSLQASDHTGSSWLSLFNDTGKKLLGCPAGDLVRMQEGGDTNGFDRVFESVHFGMFRFRLRAKEEDYNGEKRVKVVVMDLDRTNFVEDTRAMLASLRASL